MKTKLRVVTFLVAIVLSQITFGQTIKFVDHQSGEAIANVYFSIND